VFYLRYAHVDSAAERAQYHLPTLASPRRGQLVNHWKKTGSVCGRCCLHCMQLAAASMLLPPPLPLLLRLLLPLLFL
jgi:hypothetical protein